METFPIAFYRRHINSGVNSHASRKSSAAYFRQLSHQMCKVNNAVREETKLAQRIVKCFMIFVVRFSV